MLMREGVRVFDHFTFFVFHVKIAILSLDGINDDGGGMFASHTIST